MLLNTFFAMSVIMTKIGSIQPCYIGYYDRISTLHWMQQKTKRTELNAGQNYQKTLEENMLIESLSKWISNLIELNSQNLKYSTEFYCLCNTESGTQVNEFENPNLILISSINCTLYRLYILTVVMPMFLRLMGY